MWLSDFPHPTALWPNSQMFIDNSLENVTEAERKAILVDNPRRVYGLPEGY
jgi:predicted TIM-barrel fold metal-dependent hydrolase